MVRDAAAMFWPSNEVIEEAVSTALNADSVLSRHGFTVACRYLFSFTYLA